MNSTYLKTFVEVLRLKNISKAAERLYVTQPAVTKQIQLLEKEFGTKLLKKENRDIVATEDGEKLFEYAVQTIAGENKIYAELAKQDKEIEGILDIYSSSLPAEYIVPGVIVDFSKLHPNVNYCVKKLDSKEVVDMIDSGIVNFGFVGSIYKNARINYKVVSEDELIIIGSAISMSEYKDKEVDVDFFKSHKFISREDGSATLKTFENYLKSKGMKLTDLNVNVKCEDTSLIKKLVMEDIGISVVSKISVQEEIENGLLIPIKIKDEKLIRNIYFAYHSSRYFSNSEEIFRQYIFDKHVSE